MFKKGDYLVFKRDVCKVKDIKNKYIKDNDYYILSPIDDDSLTIQIPVDNKLIRKLLSKEEIISLIDSIPNIEILSCDNKTLDNEYRELFISGDLKDLIKIIKTSFLRNKEREDNHKKISDKDTFYLEKAEKYLYNEISVVLDMTFEDTKKYVINKVEEKINQ